jgi:hypothetical protein
VTDIYLFLHLLNLSLGLTCVQPIKMVQDTDVVMTDYPSSLKRLSEDNIEGPDAKRHKSAQCHLGKLPTDIFLVIRDLLDLDDLISLSKTSKWAHSHCDGKIKKIGAKHAVASSRAYQQWKGIMELELPPSTEVPDSETKQRLINAIKFGRESLVYSYLSCGVDVNTTNITGYPILYHAICSDQDNIVCTLINRGADVNMKCLYHKDIDPMFATAQSDIKFATLLKLVIHGAKFGGIDSLRIQRRSTHLANLLCYIYVRWPNFRYRWITRRITQKTVSQDDVDYMNEYLGKIQYSFLIGLESPIGDLNNLCIYS